MRCRGGSSNNSFKLYLLKLLFESDVGQFHSLHLLFCNNITAISFLHAATVEDKWQINIFAIMKRLVWVKPVYL